MRWCFTLIFLVLIAGVEARAADPALDRLDAVLRAVEARMKSVESFHAKCERTETHPLTKKVSTFVGEVAWQRPNRGKIDLAHPDDVGKRDRDKTRFERFIADGKKVYEYNPAGKLIVEHDQPADGAANPLFAFLKGMKADDLKKRFDVRLIEADAKVKDWFVHVRLTPKDESDKREFQFADLTVWLKNPNKQGEPDLTHTPCQVRYVQPNGGEVRYRFSGVGLNVRLDDAAFAPVRIDGYRFQRASR